MVLTVLKDRMQSFLKIDIISVYVKDIIVLLLDKMVDILLLGALTTFFFWSTTTFLS